MIQMDKKGLIDFITNWNVSHPYDKVWRVKHNIPLFSTDHKNMVLLDILLETEEDKLYEDARKKYLKDKELNENSIVIPLSEREYIPGQGNWLAASENKMSQSQIDDLFDKIKF